MLNEAQIGEVWMLFADYLDKKQIDIVAERYIELLADYGVRDRVLQNVIGVDGVLDHAITYYLDEDNDEEDDDDDYKELDF
jgi:hypothetical protein